MTNKAITYLAIRGFLIWLALSISGFIWGDKIITPLLPFYDMVFELASTGLEAESKIVEIDKVDYIWLDAKITQAIQVTPSAAIQAGRVVEGAKITTLHALVPLVILLTIIFAWPIKTLQQLCLHIVLAIPAVLIVSGLTAPIQLLGWVDVAFQNMAASVGYVRKDSLALKWMLLTEGGGRWFIAAIVGLGFAILASHLSKKFNDQKS